MAVEANTGGKGNPRQAHLVLPLYKTIPCGDIRRKGTELLMPGGFSPIPLLILRNQRRRELLFNKLLDLADTFIINEKMKAPHYHFLPFVHLVEVEQILSQIYGAKT